MKVALMLTCLCDAFYGEVGIAAVRLLEFAGCEVEFPASQTCCGQPPFNAGDWGAARAVASHALAAFGGATIVTPSSSCAAMLREGYGALFPGAPAPPAYELAEFLAAARPETAWPRHPAPLRIGFHRSCHGRGIGLGDAAERLLGACGVELVPFNDADQCCGFGGAFCANHPKLSAEIGLEKLRQIAASGVDEFASGDMGCLVHLNGLIAKTGSKLRTRHYAEVVADALDAAGSGSSA